MKGTITLTVRLEVGSDEFWEEVFKDNNFQSQAVADEVKDILDDHGFEGEVVVQGFDLRRE